ncbi:MAG: hypothetical protein QOD07_2872 [Frankiaceae bacterium]|jgi:hypothetical protein|nr:hypothetical protein [Frankiaceae bacterium]
MPHNGQTCEQSGIYKPSCGCKEIALSKGEAFPPCGDHGPTEWSLVQATQ